MSEPEARGLGNNLGAWLQSMVPGGSVMQSMVDSIDWSKQVNFHTDGRKAAKNAVEDLTYLSQQTALRGNVGAGSAAPLILLAGGIAKLANAGIDLASLSSTTGLVSFQFNNLSLKKAVVLIDVVNSPDTTFVQRIPAPMPPGESDVLVWSKPLSAFAQGDNISFKFCVGEIIVGLTFQPNIPEWPILVLSCGPHRNASYTWSKRPCLSGFTYKGPKKDSGSAFSVYISPLWTLNASELTVTVIDADPKD
jgi:hypothetical protein